MKTISKREGKNYEIEVKGDLHQYPDGSVHTVKEGKAVWGEGSGDSGGSGGGVLLVADNDGMLDKTMGEIQDAYLAGKRVIILTMDGGVARDVIGIVPIFRGKRTYDGTVETYGPGFVNSELVIMPWIYNIHGKETEEAARNAYPARVHSE